MARKKSVCSKWTLVILVGLVCPFVNSRPQETSSQSPSISSTTNTVTDQPTENEIRYRHRKNNFSLAFSRSNLPKVLYSVNSDLNSDTRITNSSLNLANKIIRQQNHGPNVSDSSRRSRLIRKSSVNRNSIRKINVQNSGHESGYRKPANHKPFSRKPSIRRVITKWTDKAKYEDLPFYQDISSSTEQDLVTFSNSLNVHDYSSTETIIDQKLFNNQPTYEYSTIHHQNNFDNNHNHKPNQNQNKKHYGHTNQVHLINYPFPSVKPSYIFTTPTPTPVITNVGNPMPWYLNPQMNHQPTTQKPVHVTKPLKDINSYHNSIHNHLQYNGENFDVTTFPPAAAYTERIIIRPEEYSAMDDCPTIYLTLNNTFQGQGKESCPDLNIAVNTNVVNKNIAVESEEDDDTDGFFPEAFGALDDSDESIGVAASNEYVDSDEAPGAAESASVESAEFSNFNAAPVPPAAAPAAPVAPGAAGGGGGSPSSALTAGKPGHGNKDDDDDTFSISGLMSYFQPTVNAMTWLSGVNPLSFTMMSLFLTPLAMFLAAYSGVAALFAPLGLAREAPKVVHVYKPKWEWDDKYKTWFLNSHPNDRRWRPAGRLPRLNNEVENKNNGTVRDTWLHKLKNWMITATRKLQERSESLSKHKTVRKNKRKKRETWTRRIKTSSQKSVDENKPTTESVATPNSPRDVKTKTPILGESIKLVATQLLDNSSNKSAETPIVIDTRIPPKVKNQLAHKHKIKTRNEDERPPVENSHAGIAVPVTMEELEKENSVSESSTSNEGISTWVLLSNPANVTSTEPTKIEETAKKPKPTSTKNKNKRPQPEKASSPKRPIIGSTNKSDLVAGGSAINENVYNKIKDTVLTNVQKNKNTSKRSTTTASPTTTTTASPTSEATIKRDTTTKAPSTVSVKVTAKPTKKKNKNKIKVSTTEAPIEESESALLPMEPKEQEIELEISTPPTTTKKPKRSSTRKKNKTKKRKTKPKPKPEVTTVAPEIKHSNKTKSTKTKKPSASSLMPQISSQIYSYFSREVMPSVGLGALGLASLVGIAGYFLPSFFATPVRRTFEVEKKDDIYKHNAEEYASEGNGQPEEEMLGTVLAGMPGHSKHKLNPYAGQTSHVNVNRYPTKKEQDIRYRHVASNYDKNYNMHYPQQKTGIAHGVYPDPVNYNHQQYDTRHVYPTESKYAYDKGQSGYTPRPTDVEPIYAAPQTGPQSAPSGMSGYGNDASSSVVYGIKPSSESDFKPVYPFEGQFYSETTNSPMTYPPTSMYLGSNNDSEQPEEQKYEENSNFSDETGGDNKFVVGNVPKELTESATPAIVPEHGPRSLKTNRKKRSLFRRKRGIVGSIEDILKAVKENKNEIFLSNEIDEALGLSIQELTSSKAPTKLTNEITSTPEVFTISTTSVDPAKQEKEATSGISSNTFKTEFVESVSTLPIENTKQEKSTTTDLPKDLDSTTKQFKVYEVFASNNPADVNKQSSVVEAAVKEETTTQVKNMNTETTTELKSETTSTLPPSPYPVTDPRDLTTASELTTPNPTNTPTEVLTYPPLNQDGGIFTFLKRLIEFKYRLGLSILQTTSDNLNRYLHSIDNTKTQKVRSSPKA